MPEKCVIRLEGVSTVYEGERRAAIKDVNLSLERGELAWVLGPNAAGKTTLLETINGLLLPIRGKVYVFGEDIERNLRRARCKIGYVPQDFLVDPGEPYRALDVVLMGMYGKIGVLRRPDTADVGRALEVMRLLGVEELANRPMGKLSGGQQQKIMIARALAKEPEIILLDEPFSNLDASSRQRIPELIRQIHYEKGMTTIIVMHDPTEVSRQCSRVIAMDRGRVVMDGRPSEVLPILDKRAYHRELEATR